MKVLLTGGAGFIGSNLLEALLRDKRVSNVRVVDDLSNGSYENIREFEKYPGFEFVEGDICDRQGVMKWVEGCEVISHQAALGSVPRSIKDPLRSHEVNVTGTLNILHAAKENKVRRVVLACSSSTYGDSQELPKQEDRIGNPLSPYGVTKLAIEHYARVFNQVYGLNYIGLRYFNIYGPRQSPDNPYAAVIPLFCKAFLQGYAPLINGDGENSRDFTYVNNAVQANLLALFTDNNAALNKIYNIACGEQNTLNEMVEMLRTISGKQIQPEYGPEREGDIRHSKADISRAKEFLGYNPDVFFAEGLKKTYDWYRSSGILENLASGNKS